MSRTRPWCSDREGSPGCPVSGAIERLGRSRVSWLAIRCDVRNQRRNCRSSSLPSIGSTSVVFSSGGTTSERDVSRTRTVVPGLANGGLPGLTPIPLAVAASDTTTPFAVAPEFGVKFGWRAGDSLHLTAGYSFLYWSQVVRPATLLDRNVNATTIPTAAAFSPINAAPFRPTATLNGESFWVHAVNIRLALAF